MAFPTAVNSQTPDSVTQANASCSNEGATNQLLGEIIRALGIASGNGVSKELQAEVVNQAASIVGILLHEKTD